MQDRVIVTGLGSVAEGSGSAGPIRRLYSDLVTVLVSVASAHGSTRLKLSQCL